MNNLYFRGDIWLVDLNPTIGREQSGIRPVLILSDDNFNQGFSELLIITPITSKNKGNPLHIEVVPPVGGLEQISYIKPEDIKSISKKKFIKKLGTTNTNILSKLEQNIKLLLSLT